MNATIVVCTRNRAALLADALASLVADTSSVDRELIVVDNGSTDTTAAAVEAVARSAPFPVQRLREERLGLSHARNAGVAAASGEILLFTDDDVVVEDGWADALVAAFDDARVGAAGGRILPMWPVQPPEWLNGLHSQMLTLEDYGEQDRDFAPNEYVLGANMAVRTSIARSFAPPFDPRLGHAGSRRNGHEEVLFMRRVRDAQHDIVYRAGAVVHHRVDPARMTIGFLRRSFLELGIGAGRQERVEGAALPSLPRRAARALRILRGTSRLRRANEWPERTADATWDELYGYMWLGKHVEMLFGRWPRLAEKVGDLVV